MTVLERHRLEASVFAVSFATLLVELLLTRVLSVVMYHHFSFLAVSLAMSGLGLGGALVRTFPERLGGNRLDAVAPWAAVAAAAGIVVAALFAFRSPVRLESSLENWLHVGVVLAAALVPFTLSGVVLAQAFTVAGARIARLYFVDLAGAALACAVLSPLSRVFGAPNGLLIAAAVAAAAGALLASTTSAARTVALAATGTLLVTLVANRHAGFFDVRMVKGAAAPAADIVRWNAFSRVEVRGLSQMATPRAPDSWGYSTELHAKGHEAYVLYDASAATQIIGWNGDLGAVDYLSWDVTSAAHHARTQPRTLVLGAGAGRDVIGALAAGARRVVGVEINDVTVDLMRTVLRAPTGGLYTGAAPVEIAVEDGRAYVERPGETFDLIQLSLVDTWAASSAGAYALTENGLYTAEAFDAYLRRLAPDGMLSLSRWYDAEPFEVLRLLGLVRGALLRDGVPSPEPHVLVVRTDPRLTHRPSMCTVLVKRSAFAAPERDALVAWAHRMRFLVSFADGVVGPDVLEDPRLRDALAGRDLGARALAVDLTPPTDDRPFFFDRVPLAGYLVARLRGAKTAPLPIGSELLGIAFTATLTLAGLLTMLPLVRGRERAAARGHGAVLSLAALLGLGYVGAEVVLLQRLSLFLGDPSRALSAVLGVMLLASGAGALTTRKAGGVPALARALFVAAGTLAVSAALLTRLTALASLSEGARLAVAVVVVAPSGLALGRPFPTLLRMAGEGDASLVSWVWATNGAFSVFGSVLAVVLSMTVGFRAALAGAALTYLAATLMTRRLPALTSPSTPLR